MTIKLLINGAKGRMGQTVISCAERHPQLAICASIDEGDDFEGALPTCDVVIDFSAPQATGHVAQSCAHFRKTLVIGTTGQSDATRQMIRESAQTIPIVFAPNFSVGVNTLFWLVQKAAEILGPDFDLEIVEMHHDQKKDAPSGTARRLAEILCDVRGLTYDEDIAHGRHGLVGERGAEIGMHALRGGDVVGDHAVIFARAGERLELAHKASSRETFATGALRAAAWAGSMPPGLYDMQDVLGLREIKSGR